MLLRQESVTTQIPQGKQFSHQPIIHLRPEEQQPVALMVHIVSAEIDGEPVLTMEAWPNGSKNMFLLLLKNRTDYESIDLSIRIIDCYHQHYSNPASSQFSTLS